MSNGSQVAEGVMHLTLDSAIQRRAELIQELKERWSGGEKARPQHVIESELSMVRQLIKTGVVSKPVTMTARVSALTLLNLSYLLLVKLRDAKVDLYPEDVALIQKIREFLTDGTKARKLPPGAFVSPPTSSDPLVCAHGCWSSSLQSKLEVSAAIALRTLNKADLASMRKDAANLSQTLSGQPIGDDVLKKIVRAYLSAGDVLSAAEILVLNPVHGAIGVPMLWSDVFRKSGKPDHLASARSSAELLDQPFAAAMAWAYVFSASENAADWSRIETCMAKAITAEPDRSDWVRARIAAILGMNGHRARADMLMVSVRAPGPIIHAACAIGRRFKESTYLEMALSAARKIDQLTFLDFRNIVKLAYAIGSADAIRGLTHSSSPTAACYALSVLAAMTKGEERSLSIAKAGGFATALLKDPGQKNASETLAAFAWSLAISGQYDKALAVAGGIGGSGIWRCFAYLSIYSAQKGHTGMEDVNL